MTSFQRKILITGGAGFIGSHVVRRFVKSYPQYMIYNLDKLTYAGNLENLKDVEHEKNYKFIKGDIVNSDFLQQLFEKERFDGVIHLAAESHVDRSIVSPMDFINTNIIGTVNLLTASKSIWQTADSKSKIRYSTRSLLMKFMARSAIRVILRKKHRMIPVPPIQPQRPVQITLFGRMAIRMVCQ